MIIYKNPNLLNKIPSKSYKTTIFLNYFFQPPKLLMLLPKSHILVHILANEPRPYYLVFLKNFQLNEDFHSLSFVALAHKNHLL